MLFNVHVYDAYYDYISTKYDACCLPIRQMISVEASGGIHGVQEAAQRNQEQDNRVLRAQIPGIHKR